MSVSVNTNCLSSKKPVTTLQAHFGATHLFCSLAKHKQHSVYDIALATAIGTHHRGERLQYQLEGSKYTYIAQAVSFLLHVPQQCSCC